MLQNRHCEFPVSFTVPLGAPRHRHAAGTRSSRRQCPCGPRSELTPIWETRELSPILTRAPLRGACARVIASKTWELFVVCNWLAEISSTAFKSNIWK